MISKTGVSIMKTQGISVTQMKHQLCLLCVPPTLGDYNKTHPCFKIVFTHFPCFSIRKLMRILPTPFPIILSLLLLTNKGRLKHSPFL